MSVRQAVATRRILLVGNPNTGKSTLFNALTGSHQDVRNAPGTTVEMSSGVSADLHATVVDLPGTYSLLAKSPDEQVTADALRAGDADLVIVMIDASALPRSIYLLGQVARLQCPIVAALTMSDLAAQDVDRAALAAALGVPVVRVNPRTAAGIGDLAAVVDARPAGREQPAAAPACPRRAATSCCAAPATPVPAVAGQGRAPLARELADAEDLFGWVEEVLQAIGHSPGHAAPTRSDRIDRFLLHPAIGIPVFLALMWALFKLTTSIAEPVMDGAQALVAGPVAGGVDALLRAASLTQPWLRGLVIDGVLAGAGVVLSFVPLMAIMFCAIAALEDSGYLARAAFTADRAMRMIGLDGRAIMPLIVGFGCNLPALAATRTLPNARQRLITAIIVPYASCAARLTVYILLAAAFFGPRAGTVIFCLYLASIALIVLGGLVLRVVLPGGRGRGEPLLLVLPAYQVPRLRALGGSVLRRVRAFVAGAGKVIVATLTIVWALQAVPVTGGHRLAEVPVADSLYGTVAESIAPAFAPAGFGSWQASSALLTGFVAKEVVVGNMAQSFAVAEPDEARDAGSLGEKVRANFEETSGGHGRAAALAFMIFSLAYTPCLATLAEQRRMLGWKITGAAFGVQLALAWVLAVGAFNIARIWW